MQLTAEEHNRKRIVSNTLLLYFRMFFTTIVSLYTSRVVLNSLGVEDYGIYNVVGGVVAMLSFLTTSLSGAASRFITYSLGKDDIEQLGPLFGTIKFMHILLALLIFFFAETLGLWFLNNELVIPVERVKAAQQVYQCSICTALIGVISIPYNSLIIAYEKMNVYAYVSIVDCLLRLFVVLVLTKIQYDRLVSYSILLIFVQLISFSIYRTYARKTFVESKTRPLFNIKIIKEVGSYMIWTVNGNLAVVGYTQGLNMLLNIFFGPIVNAARAISVQVQNAMMTFNQSFLTAINPQITKSYASGNMSFMHQLVISASRFGTYLMMLIAFPILLNIKSILFLWLGIIPEYTIDFVKIMLITLLLQPMARTLVTSIHATGQISKFQIYEGTSLLMILPIAYILLKFCNISPVTVMWVYFGVELITQLIRVYIVLPQIGMGYLHYINYVLLPMLLPLIFFMFPLFLMELPILTLGQLFFSVFISFLYIFFVIVLLGTSLYEKKSFLRYVANFIQKLVH